MCFPLLNSTYKAVIPLYVSLSLTSISVYTIPSYDFTFFHFLGTCLTLPRRTKRPFSCAYIFILGAPGRSVSFTLSHASVYGEGAVSKRADEGGAGKSLPPQLILRVSDVHCVSVFPCGRSGLLGNPTRAGGNTLAKYTQAGEKRLGIL